MKCTSCKNGQLLPSFIDDAFRAHTCNNCGGNWILVEDYVAWKERHPEHEFSSDSTCEPEESAKAILCPLTGTIMRKFKLSSNTEHKIDYSAIVGGVWLDKGEWELLKREKLAGSLNAILTSHWQKNVRLESTKDNFSAIYQDKFGEDSYKKVKDMRTWLAQQENKADLRAYLLAEDPYSAEK